ncbi:uncharacterized protein B0I36DRAFT_142875 [Microdochium trichocladiopsis]|uniref:Uncharacterized protein n=1 Tax=Microdochium trichocladiopsis TaxID=1682393 RepID=A0A9P8Y4F0_9PEZI|nr:uncharacterized protein B0I36DRAFT_142875 [Microdochium trichocladiopsis]KAH7027747.1 hypothetical protein B0I36DRAFT_142875 [Microdochium trichocladiopsis]
MQSTRSVSSNPLSCENEPVRRTKCRFSFTHPVLPMPPASTWAVYKRFLSATGRPYVHMSTGNIPKRAQGSEVNGDGTHIDQHLWCWARCDHERVCPQHGQASRQPPTPPSLLIFGVLLLLLLLVLDGFCTLAARSGRGPPPPPPPALSSLLGAFPSVSSPACVGSESIYIVCQRGGAFFPDLCSWVRPGREGGGGSRCCSYCWLMHRGVVLGLEEGQREGVVLWCRPSSKKEKKSVMTGKRL